MRLDGKVAIITGASRGLGKACAEAMAREGAAVVIAARTEEVQDPRLPGTIHETAQQIEAAGGQALAVRVNVSDPASIAGMVEATLERFGRVDILVNNAAIQPPGSLSTIQLRHWELEFKVNLHGPFWCTRAVLEPMRANGGSIINVSSAGANAAMGDRAGHYGIGKVALEAMTRGFATELREAKIAVNALKPRGGVDTPGYRFARGGDAAGAPGPEDFAEACVILATAPASAVSGQALFDYEVLERWGRGGTVPA